MIIQDEIVKVKPQQVGDNIFILDIPNDSIIVRQLDKWRNQMDWQEAILGDGLTVYELYDEDERDEIRHRMSEEYLNDTILPQEKENPHCWDMGDTNFIQLNPFLNYHKVAHNVIKDYLKIEGYVHDHPSGCHWFPPSGWMGWHTNADIFGYRMYCVYAAEDNKSFIRIRDPKTKEIITSWDKKGWNFRMFLCDTDDPDNYAWHCIYSDTNRISVGFHYQLEGQPSNLEKYKNVIYSETT
jgi:hypothetical protein